MVFALAVESKQLLPTRLHLPFHMGSQALGFLELLGLLLRKLTGFTLKINSQNKVQYEKQTQALLLLLLLFITALFQRTCFTMTSLSNQPPMSHHKQFYRS